MSLLISFCAVVGVAGINRSTEAIANSSSHIVTFNYNTSNIMQYLPDNTSLKNALKSYVVTVQDGGYAVETSKPGNIISPYYSYVWTYNDNAVDLSTFKITRDTEFVAKWVPKVYKVLFKFESEEVKNKVSNLQTQITFTVESPRINLYRPMIDHYYFEGWYDSSSPYEYMYIPERSVGDKIFTARFSPIKYWINYNTGADSAENPDFYTIEDSDFALYNPQKEGHIFHGWYSDSEFKNRVYVVDTALGRNIELYPLWELETYKVTYILPNGISKVVECEYGEKAPLPKNLKKGIFEIVKTDVSRKNITEDTVIHIEYVNIWYVYVLSALTIAGIVILIICIKKKRDNTHNKLRMIYQSKTNRNSRKY